MSDMNPPLAPAHEPKWDSQSKTKQTTKELWSGWKKLTEWVKAKLAADDTIHPAQEDYYKARSTHLVHRDVAQGLARIFDSSPGAIPAWTKVILANACDEQFPSLRRSSLRAFVEGKLTGGQPPITGLKVTDARVAVVLHCLDVIETLAHEQEKLAMKELLENKVPEPAKKPKPKPEPTPPPPPEQPIQEEPANAPPSCMFALTCPNCGNEYETVEPLAKCPNCKVVIDPAMLALAE